MKTCKALTMNKLGYGILSLTGTKQYKKNSDKTKLQFSRMVKHTLTHYQRLMAKIKKGVNVALSKYTTL